MGVNPGAEDPNPRVIDSVLTGAFEQEQQPKASAVIITETINANNMSFKLPARIDME
jgi:hypothetical protein